jgi:hypothetical protein
VALAVRHGLAGQFMKDWEDLSHPQSRLRITRLDGLRYIAIAESGGRTVSWRRPTGVQGCQRSKVQGCQRRKACQRTWPPPPGLRTGNGT